MVEVLHEADFRPLAQTGPLPGVGCLMVGPDQRLYRRANGLIELICQADPVEDTEPGVWLGKVKWEEYPPIKYLASLYDKFLSKYDREVMFVVGKRYRPTKNGDKWFCMVPWQEGTKASIHWEDKEGMDWFLQRARFLGTVHIHPGDSASPSMVDIENWEKRDQSGLHLIFGRGGEFTAHGSVAGHVVSLGTSSVNGTKREDAPLYTSLNRKLKKLLRKPKPVKIVRAGGQFDFKEWWEKYCEGGHGRGKIDPIRRYLWDACPVGGTNCFNHVDRMWLVPYGDRTYFLSEKDYTQYRRIAVFNDWYDAPEGTCFVPERAGVSDDV